MHTISITYTIKYCIDFAPYYGFCGKQCINMRTGRFIKQVLCGGSIGYCIGGRFYSLKYLRSHLIKIPKSDCPF
jgi:hypothetical protein